MKVDLQEPEPKLVRDDRAIRKALADIANAHPEKLLTASAVVEAARDPESPLHSEFEWDVAKAAYQHLLSQARSLIRHVEVTFPDDQSESAVPKYVSLKSDRRKPGGGYRETSKVLSNKELLAELEQSAKEDLAAWSQRYKMLSDLCQRVKKAAGIEEKKKARSR